ncbi:hypothetical protein P4H66_03500 [Paenibacillus dokdonensis]|uniref:Uncharacterized protein n=1 Tax=Paenibacillus dokdonensis TaxID=2567944 RepID=A0ABU6GGS4_9BACL|nr:hypothetical protein [Paenibacillus dokdonensis]MEC0238935.1 hypothetical protein [Paenibacillus dokdonensis]
MSLHNQEAKWSVRRYRSKDTPDPLQLFERAAARLPSMEELVIKTGKTKKDITQCLINLEDQLFIIWENKKYVETIKIIQGWENGETVKEERKTSTTSNTDYWTQY